MSHLPPRTIKWPRAPFMGCDGYFICNTPKLVTTMLELLIFSNCVTLILLVGGKNSDNLHMTVVNKLLFTMTRTNLWVAILSTRSSKRCRLLKC
jgi:hypothetical protein